MVAQVRLTVAGGLGGSGAAIIANGTLTDSNAFTLGSLGNNGDIYVNTDWSCTNNANTAGSVYVLGKATETGPCAVAVDLWANGAISWTNTDTVGHNVTSSTSSITMSSNSHVANNARAGTTCGGCNSSTVSGTITVNSPQGAPPILPFPQITYDPSVWTAAGYLIQSFTDCTLAKNFIQNVGVPTKYVVRITGGCTLSGTSTVTVQNDLAIITDGPINITNAITYASAVPGVRHTLYIEIPYVDPTTCTSSKNITYTNTMTFTDLDTLLYTPCDIKVTNKATGLTGQVFGRNIDASNQFSVTYKAIQMPGVSNGGFKLDIAYIRDK